MMVYNMPSLPIEEIPYIEIHSVNIFGTDKTTRIHRLPVKSPWTLTASCVNKTTGLPQMPNGQFVLIVEKTVNGQVPVTDERFLATVDNGIITCSGSFETSGNYFISDERLSRGLQEIGLNVNLKFDKVEFDAYNV